MISILLISMKEEGTIGKCVTTLLQGLQTEFELLVSIPDEPTWLGLLAATDKLGITHKVKRSELSLAGKPLGKPVELSALMDMAKGEYWVFCDGDTYFGPEAILELLKGFKTPKIQAVSGRPVSADQRDNMMGYFGHLLSDAAHFKRVQELVQSNNDGFFPVSGYLFAMRASKIRPAPDTLVEDAYISYEIARLGGEIGYSPEALVYVYYPRTLGDYFKQKKRSAGGYVQLWSYGLVNKKNNKRSFLKEAAYAWFPFDYALNKKEWLWSALLYPIRVWMWVLIFWEQKVMKKDFSSTWVRIESTKR